MDDVLRLSGRLRMELLSLVILSPLLQSDLRATPSSRMWLVDASSKKIAVVSTPLGDNAAKELGRFTLRKGSWSRMIPPAMQWARRHNILAEEDELPDGIDPDVAGSRWIWEELVQNSSFRLDRAKRARAFNHINFSELLSFGEAEHLATGTIRLNQMQI